MKQHTRSHTSFDEAFAYEVLSVVEEIPEGKVATYGQIARLIGKEKNSRLVARALSHAEQFGEFPCHRVVNHAGRLAPGWVEQGFLLMQEGVELKDRNHVDLKKYQWDCCLCCCQSCDRNTEWRTGNVVQTDLVAELYGRWISAMLATDTNVQIWIGGFTKFDSHLHQFANTNLIQFCEWIILINLSIIVRT